MFLVLLSTFFFQFEIGGGDNFNKVTLWEKELHKTFAQTTITGVTSETEFR